jgi:hypothetical protein
MWQPNGAWSGWDTRVGPHPLFSSPSGLTAVTAGSPARDRAAGTPDNGTRIA